MKTNGSAKDGWQVSVICLSILILFAVSMFFRPALVSSQLSGAQTFESDLQTFNSALDVQNRDNTVFVGFWLINIFDYHYTTSGYTIDMYLYFFWTDANINNIDWFFANGYPITPTSITLVESNITSDVKHEIYRATARLSSPPDASDFPFDKINVTVSIDLLTHGKNYTISWLGDQTGIDEQFINPGWKTDSVELLTLTHSYPLGVQVPRAEMVITQQRQRTATSYSPFVPPAIFSIVCAISFLFSLKEMGAVGLRIGLNTSMLVTTLLFSFGVGSNIPPASNMVLYTIFLLSVLIFMVCNLIVTVIGVVGWLKYRNEKRTKIANQLGFLISLIVPIGVFLLLFYLRV